MLPGIVLRLLQDLPLGAFPGRLDRESWISTRVEAGVAAHRFFEPLPVFRANVRCLIQRIKTGVAVLQVEGFDEAAKSKPVGWAFAGEQRSQRV